MLNLVAIGWVVEIFRARCPSALESTVFMMFVSLFVRLSV